MVKKAGMPDEVAPIVARAGYEYMELRSESSLTTCVVCIAHEGEAKPGNRSALALELLRQRREEP